MTLHEASWTWVEFADEGGEAVANDVTSFKTVEDWESDATIQLTRGDVFGALRIYEEILKVYPQYIKAWYNRAVILEQYVKDFRQALWSYDQALSLDPNNVDILHNKATLLSDLRQYDEAEKHFIRALQSKPNYLKSLMGLAANYYYQGRFDEALRAVSLAEKQKLESELKADLLSLKATILDNMGKSKQAIKAAKQGLALNPKNDSLWETAGLAYFNIRKYREAVRCLNMAIQINPGNVAAQQTKRDILDNLADMGVIVPDDHPGL